MLRFIGFVLSLWLIAGGPFSPMSMAEVPAGDPPQTAAGKKPPPSKKDGPAHETNAPGPQPQMAPSAEPKPGQFDNLRQPERKTAD